MSKYTQVNNEAWDAWAALHVDSDYYDVEGFKKGSSTLNRIELEELGDVVGRALLHLQCHFGLDSLSLARMGAEVTGVDFSSEAIANAQRLNDEVGLKARFIRSDIYELPDSLDGQFDIVFTSYGVLRWLPDVERWGKAIARCLKPGGVFHIVEYHPFASVFEADGPITDFKVASSYFHRPEPFEYQGQATYASDGDGTTHTSYEWAHGVGDIVNALTAANLHINFIHEFPFMDWKGFPFLEQDADGLWKRPDSKPQMPLMFSLKAHKTAAMHDRNTRHQWTRNRIR